VKISNVLHNGLLRFIETADASGVAAATVPTLRRMITFLQDMETEAELHSVPTWKVHRLRGDRRHVWSLHVTQNWRLMFWIERSEIVDLNFEDCH
jgi:toxin HigB-1